jgi:hypothetical protein
VDFQGETTTVIDFGVGRHTLVSREDHPDSPSFFRIATDTAQDPFKGIHISHGGSEIRPWCLEGMGVTRLIQREAWRFRRDTIPSDNNRYVYSQCMQHISPCM